MGLCVAVRFSPLLSLFRRGLRPPSLGRLSRPKCCPRMGLHQAPKLAGGMTSRMLGVPPARCRLRGSRGRTPGISAPVTRSAADKSGANPAPDGEFTHLIKSIIWCKWTGVLLLGAGFGWMTAWTLGGDGASGEEAAAGAATSRSGEAGGPRTWEAREQGCRVTRASEGPTSRPMQEP